MMRIFMALIFATAVTFFLLAFMAYLVSSDDVMYLQSDKTPQFVISPTRKDSLTQRIVRFKARPLPLDSPPPPSPIQTERTDKHGIVFDLPVPTFEHQQSMLTRPKTRMMQEGEATPLIRVEPRYPFRAAQDGKEGYVLLSFTINKLGGVEDIKVIKSEPKRLFDKAAKRALKRWKYKPKILNGQPQRQTGQRVILDFTLEKKRGR